MDTQETQKENFPGIQVENLPGTPRVTTLGKSKGKKLREIQKSIQHLEILTCFHQA